MENLCEHLSGVLKHMVWQADHCEGRGAENFFTHDAVIANQDGTEFASGIAEIVELQRAHARYRRRHIYCNSLLLECSADQAKMACINIVYIESGLGGNSPAASPTLVSDSVIDFVRVSDGIWRIARTVSNTVFGSPEQHPIRRQLQKAAQRTGATS